MLDRLAGIFGGGPQGGANRQNFLQRGLSGLGQGLSNFGERMGTPNENTGVSGLQMLGLGLTGFSDNPMFQQAAMMGIQDSRQRFQDEQAEREAEARRDAAIALLGERELTPGQEEFLRRAGPQFAEELAAQTFAAPEQPDLPSSVREYQFAVSQGYEGSFADYQRDMAETTRVVTQPESAASQLTAMRLDQFSDMIAAGDAASRNLVRLDRMGELLDEVDTGAAAPIALAARRFGLNLGDNVSELEALNALISQLVPEQRAPGSGVMSDADLQLYRDSLPALLNSPEGNQLIFETMRAINEHDRSAARIAQRVAAGELTVQQANDELRNLSNPVDRVRSFMSSSQVMDFTQQ